MIFTAEESWQMSEPEKVLAIIKEMEIWRLGNWDGCCCCQFNIRNVSVDISCGKGRKQGVWINGGELDYGPGALPEKLLRPVADEVVRQLTEMTSRSGDWPVHFREWDRELDEGST
jgi:hypothetical protein